VSPSGKFAAGDALNRFDHLTRPFLRPDLVEGALVERQQPTLGNLPALDAEDAIGLPLDGPTIALSLAAREEYCSRVVRKYVVNVHFEGTRPSCLLWWK
jgi:hypothetical protein